MISRYDSQEMSAIWTDHNKFQNFLQVELKILEALEEANSCMDHRL